MQFFRNFFKSKIGLGITFAFIALIALAFASSDIAGTGTFGGVAGGNRVAVVGDEKIGSADLSRATSQVLDNVRRDNPTISMQAFVEQGGFEGVIDQLIDRFAIREYAEKYGLRAGENLVNSEILQIPAFRGPDGSFDQESYRAALAAQGLSDATIRDDLAAELLARQLLTPATLGARVPAKLARQYTALLRERRQGGIALIPSAAFAPSAEPTEAQLRSFYTEVRSNYIKPERRTVRYASFGGDALEGRISATEAEIAARYQRDRAQYAASETRTFTQLVVSTREAADTISSRVAAGASLASAAQQAGFRTTQVGPVTRAQLASSANQAVANAGFSASSGAVATPQRGPLGWYVLKVDAIQAIPARSLAQVRAEIAETVTREKRSRALAEVGALVEEQLDEGASLNEIAQDMELTVTETPPLTADGRVYADPDAQVPEALRPTLETAFQMQEGEPQVAEIEPGRTYLLFEVGEITESAAAPFAEIRERLSGDWKLAQGSARANQAAERIRKKIDAGKTLAQALAEETVALPAAQQVNAGRQEILGANRQVPPPLALLFSMAEGTTKKLEGANNLGWFVVDLQDISTDPIAADDPLVGATQRQLAAATADEYGEQLLLAMRRELGVERNEPAIEAVRKQLVGDN